MFPIVCEILIVQNHNLRISQQPYDEREKKGLKLFLRKEGMVRTYDRMYSQSSVNDGNIVSRQASSSPLFFALSQSHFQ